MLRFNVEYTKRVSYEAVVELDSEDIEQLLKDAVSADYAVYENGELTVTVSADVDDMIREKVENGDVDNETATYEDGDVEDVEVQGLT